MCCVDVFFFSFLSQLQVSGQSMTSLCKLLFKVGRIEENDKLFLEDDILGEYENVLTNNL